MPSQWEVSINRWRRGIFFFAPAAGSCRVSVEAMSKEKKKTTKSKTADSEAGQVSPASPVEKPAKKKAAASKEGKAVKPKKADPAKAVKKSAKSAVPKAAAAGSRPVKAKLPLAISHDDIALRAYFIAERRNFFGAPGDASSDWIEAERQLRAEAAGS